MNKIFKSRITSCESCELFIHSTRQCNNCHCFMDIKTKCLFDLDDNGKAVIDDKNVCPLKKW